jgi:hypothetical protein
MTAKDDISEIAKEVSFYSRKIDSYSDHYIQGFEGSCKFVKNCYYARSDLSFKIPEIITKDNNSFNR